MAFQNNSVSAPSGFINQTQQPLTRPSQYQSFGGGGFVSTVTPLNLQADEVLAESANNVVAGQAILNQQKELLASTNALIQSAEATIPQIIAVNPAINSALTTIQILSTSASQSADTAIAAASTATQAELQSEAVLSQVQSAQNLITNTAIQVQSDASNTATNTATANGILTQIVTLQAQTTANALSANQANVGAYQSYQFVQNVAGIAANTVLNANSISNALGGPPLLHNQTITYTGDATGEGTNSVILTLASAGTMGTYTKVITDAKGRVTAGGNLALADVTNALGYTPLANNQTVALSGDATGSGQTSISVTLTNSGVTAGTYTKLTVDAKGRATAGASLASADVTTALGFTPYNATNPSAYISGITSTNVIMALGFTPSNKAGDTFTGSVGWRSSTNPYNVLQTSGGSSTSGYVATFNASGTRIGYGSYWDGTNYIAAMTDSTTSVVMGTNGTTRFTINSAGAATFTGSIAAASLTTTGGISGGDHTASRGDGSGVIFLGNGYLFFNGSSYITSGAYPFSTGSYVLSGGAIYLSGNTGIGFYWDGGQIVCLNSFYSAGNGNFNDVLIRSDARLKSNIVALADVGSKIDAIQVKSFNKDGDSRLRYGVLAQELELISPESVIYDEEHDLRSVDTSNLLFLAVREIQSLRARVQMLEGVTVH